MLRKGALAVAIMVLSGIAIAQEEAEEGPWSGDLSLGYLSTSGNTDTTNYKTSFGIGYTRNDWEHRFSAASNGAVDTDVTTAESYQAGWRSTYNFTEKDFVFGTVDWRKDRFAAELRAQLWPHGHRYAKSSPGFGYRCWLPGFRSVRRHQ